MAKEKGLVGAEWYTCPIPRKRMKELMKRKNGPAIRDTIIWFAALLITGVIAYRAWGTWWAVPAFAVYGVLWGTCGDSRQHESGHGTPFKTPWMNEALYQITSFMILRPATVWRWSHTRHHTDTIIVGSDPEIVTERPPVWKIILIEFFRMFVVVKDYKRTIIHFFGKMNEEEEKYIPSSEHKKSVLGSACFYTRLFGCDPFVRLHAKHTAGHVYRLAGFFYGSWLGWLFVLTQHLGLNEDVLDHRLNCRTFYTNPIIRFLYWNMNYHIEHHMFPMVPYHALPALHKEMKSDCPAAAPSLWAALKEVISVLIRQRKDPAYNVVRPLPATAWPYRYGPHPFGTVVSDVTDVQELKATR